MVWVVRKKARNEGGERLKKKGKKGGSFLARFFLQEREFFRGKKGLERIYVLFAVKKKSCTRNAKLKVALA